MRLPIYELRITIWMLARRWRGICGAKAQRNFETMRVVGSKAARRRIDSAPPHRRLLRSWQELNFLLEYCGKFVSPDKKALDIPFSAPYTSPSFQGYGVIGNTSVSGTAIRGSSPCSPSAGLIAEKRSGLIFSRIPIPGNRSRLCSQLYQSTNILSGNPCGCYEGSVWSYEVPSCRLYFRRTRRSALGFNEPGENFTGICVRFIKKNENQTCQVEKNVITCARRHIRCDFPLNYQNRKQTRTIMKCSAGHTICKGWRFIG